MNQRLPKPPVPEDACVQHFEWMPLDITRLQNSETWAAASGDEAKALLNLWMRAWHQVPAGSLPDNDRLLAVWSGIPNWSDVAEFVRANFVLCSDGRLYQPTLCEAVSRQLKRSTSARDSAKSRWDKKKLKNANAQPTQSERNATAMRESMRKPCENDAMEKEKVSSVFSGSVEPENPEAPGSFSTTDDGTKPRPDLSDETVQLYHRGRQLFGKSAGGLVKKLLTAQGGSVPKARAVLEQASERADPREYVGGVIRNQTGPPDDKPLSEMSEAERDQWVDRHQKYAI